METQNGHFDPIDVGDPLSQDNGDEHFELIDVKNWEFRYIGGKSIDVEVRYIDGRICFFEMGSSTDLVITKEMVTIKTV